MCINSESFLGNLIAGIQLSDVNCPDDRADIVINIRQSGSIGDRKLLPEHILVHGILVKRQFNGFAAARKRYVRVIAENDLNISCSIAFTQELHSGDSHIRAVQRQCAAAKRYAAACNTVLLILYCAFRNIVVHDQVG